MVHGMNNPQARNALSIRMMHQLKQHLTTLSNEDARVLFICGSNHHSVPGVICEMSST